MDIETQIKEHLRQLEQEIAHWRGVLSDTEKLQRVKQARATVSQSKENGKAALVRELLQSKKSEGVTPAEIRAAAKAKGLPLVAAYPYTQLRKMLDQKKVKKSGGKYFLAS